MKFSKYLAIGGMALALGTSSCVGDLDLTPTDPNKKVEITDADQWRSYFAQLYAGLVLSGINGGSDIAVDETGAGVYTRVYWNLQELASDEALIGLNWDDPGISELNYAQASTNNHWLYETYSRFMFQIKMCAEFMNRINAAQGVLPADEIADMKAEARVVRDLSYYHLIDLFGKGPWVTESSATNVTPPTLTRPELYDSVVNDLVNVIPQIKPASEQVYGRVSREGARALLAKMYLNAEVYTGTPAWDKCAEQCQEITKTINRLADDYRFLFCATNDKYVGTGEILWGIPQDEHSIQTFGGTTYLAVGAYNGAYKNLMKQLGVSEGSGWGGPRVRPELSRSFEQGDKRRLIHEGDLQEDLTDIGAWTEDGCGYMCIKWVYTPESDYTNESGNYINNTGLSSADFPLFRLADIYLMLAECYANGVSSVDGVRYFNLVHERAGLNPVSSITKDDILRERMCELYWEGHRRSDLIRFGKYTGNAYTWQWKGGTQEGTGIEAYRNLYPIPYQFVPTLGQNDGY